VGGAEQGGRVSPAAGAGAATALGVRGLETLESLVASGSQVDSLIRPSRSCSPSNSSRWLSNHNFSSMSHERGLSGIGDVCQ
jgi:hypothetical protein